MDYYMAEEGRIGVEGVRLSGLVIQENVKFKRCTGEKLEAQSDENENSLLSNKSYWEKGKGSEVYII